MLALSVLLSTPLVAPLNTSLFEMLRRPIESTQYTAIEFGSRCRTMGVRPSMGSVGDAYDNAMAESFFASLECELIDRRTFKTKSEARLAVFTYIEGWYNPRRRHSALAYQSPANFERLNHDTLGRQASSLEPDLPTVSACETGATPPVDKSATALTEPA